jgi:hypothetical protein
MRLNKKYPEAYASSNQKCNALSKKGPSLFAVMEMRSNQQDSLDDEDDDIVPSMVRAHPLPYLC